jgi:hypothetical protein
MRAVISQRTLFLAASALLVVTNLFVLAGVWLNRSGETTSEITLTERELPLLFRGNLRENSALSLRIAWRHAAGNAPAWLEGQKLEALGFDPDAPNATKKLLLSRSCFIVLEYNGTAYRGALERAQAAYDEIEAASRLGGKDPGRERSVVSAERRLKRIRDMESRLYAVDVGLDPEALRQRYPDRSRFLIVGGVVRPHYLPGEKRLRGYIQRLDIASIHIPLDKRALFEPLVQVRKHAVYGLHRPRYEVTLRYGSRYEPWIERVGGLGAE